MRILTVGNMYPPHHLGGYELMWRSAVAHHRAAGHDVRVLTTDWREAGASPADEREVHRKLRWYWHDHEFPRLTVGERLALERHNAGVLDHQIEDFTPEVVSWWAMGGMSLSLIERAGRAGLPAAATVVDDWLIYGPRVDAWWRLFRRRARRLESSSRFLFASHTLRASAREAGFDPPRAGVSHPGIDLELFKDPGKKESSWSWRLLYCGRIDERKGIDTAIKALGRLPPEATLRIVGGGDASHLTQLHALVDRLGLADRVSFERHRRSELPEIYAAADALIFPVRWVEPFGLVPLESMACGTPVVATGRGGSGEYLRDGENCLLFGVEGGAPALAEALDRLARDPELRGRLAATGRTVAERFPEGAFNDACLATLERARRESSGQ